RPRAFLSPRETPAPRARGPCPRRGPCAIVAAMKIARLESLHADAGQRNSDFLKITTDDGLVGWSEYNESFGGAGVSGVIDGLAPQLVGRDPRAYEALVTLLYAVRRQAAGGIAHQAIGAIENALLDLKARTLGVPVYELLGGPVRDRIRLYWAHCGTYRVSHAELIGKPPIRTLDDVVRLGEEVAAGGWTALKTNILLLDRDKPRRYSAGLNTGPSSRRAQPTCSSSTCSTTAWPRRCVSPPCAMPTRSTWPPTTATARWPP